MTKETTRPVETGIVKVYRGAVAVSYRATVWVVDAQHARGGKMLAKRFALTTPLATIRTWRETAGKTAALTPAILPPPAPEGFAADAARYLRTVQAMPSISDRTLHIEDWVAIFGSRTTAEIDSTLIRAQRDRWLTVGPRRVQQQVNGIWTQVLVAKPLAPHSVNLRLRALENLWSVLWPKAENPVRAVPECDEPEAIDRGVSFEVVQEILAHMPDWGRSVKGGPRDADSKTRARIAVELWTGLAHTQLAQLVEATHVNYATMTYFRPRRKKGRRGDRNRAAKAERPQPLLPQAAAALRHFFAIGAAGPFSRSSVYKSFKRAIDRANRARVAAHTHAGLAGAPVLIPTTLRPYDVKHTFGGEAYRASKDLRAVQELLGLSRLELADRYAHSAIAPAAAEAARKLGLRAGETLLPDPTAIKKTNKIA